jgi:hypothetical protein
MHYAVYPTLERENGLGQRQVVEDQNLIRPVPFPSTTPAGE